MSLKDALELENTQRKLRELEEAYDEAAKRPIDNADVRSATLISLRRLINQLTEEIARFSARTSSQRGAAPQ